MKQAAIAIENWKLSIFERHLSQAGYAFHQAEGLGEKNMFLIVKTSNLEALGEVVKAANTEAQMTGEQR